MFENESTTMNIGSKLYHLWVISQFPGIVSSCLKIECETNYDILFS